MNPVLDPRVQQLVARDAALTPITRQFQAHMLDEREALIQMLIQLSHDKDRLTQELVTLSEHQAATLPMGRHKA